jgi:hypothetical protein
MVGKPEAPKLAEDPTRADNKKYMKGLFIAL